MKYYLVFENTICLRYLNTLHPVLPDGAIEVSEQTFKKSTQRPPYGKMWQYDSNLKDIVLMDTPDVETLVAERNLKITLGKIDNLILTTIQAYKYDTVDMVFRYASEKGIYQEEAIALSAYIKACEVCYDIIDGGVSPIPTISELNTMLPTNPKGFSVTDTVPPTYPTYTVTPMPIPESPKVEVPKYETYTPSETP